MSIDRTAGQAGFTLIEALVAMALLLAFLSVLVPHLFYARRIADHIDDRVAAQALLRTLLDAPVDRSTLGKAPREGETDRLRWSVVAEPMFVDAMVPETASPQPAAVRNGKDLAASRSHWAAFRLIAQVSWGAGHMVSGETLRLGLGE